MANDIAIIGMGLRLGGGIDDEETFWETLVSGKCTRSDVPASRFNAAGYQTASQGGSFLTQDLNEWDSPFFRTLPQEASALDPQQRLMLEIVYEAIENSGTPITRLAEHPTGCWIGGANVDWHDLNMLDIDGSPLVGALSGSAAYISGRISWFFNLNGPSLTINTACSSGLVALDAACQSLRAGLVNMAIVGGVNLCENPSIFQVLRRDNFISPDGRCKPFSSKADGYGRGEAVTAVLLKPLETAVADGDPIRGIIRATGANHDGTTVGVALPNEDAQFELFKAVYSNSGLDPRDTVYVEAHGTGTAAGDPTECRALERAARQSGRHEKLLVGSVKGNTGHTEYAAGLVSVIKAVLMLEKSTIAPTIVVDGLTTAVPWADSLLHVVQNSQTWPIGRPKRVGVSCFGASGTNVHVVVDGVDAVSPRTGQHKCLSRSRLFAVTGNDRITLTQQLHRLHHYISEWHHMDNSEELEHLRNLAYTLGVRRSILPWKCTVVADSRQGLLDALSRAGYNSEGITISQQPDLVFVFTGQGAQWPRMGLQLMQYDAFATAVQFADDFIRDELNSGWSVLTELSRHGEDSKIHEPRYSQTLCTVLQLALVDLLAELGIRPNAVVGHSSGEIAASYCSGATSRVDCLRLAYWRGQACNMLIRDGLAGGMLAASMDFSIATEWTSEASYSSATVACDNSPSSVTFSGDVETIDRLNERCQQTGVWSRRLKVPLAYHSPSMMEAADFYLDKIQNCVSKRVRKQSQAEPVMVSTVSMAPITEDEIAPSYWVRNLVMPVRFNGALQSLVKEHTDPAKSLVVLEIGPSNTLRTAVADVAAHIGRDKGTHYLSAIDRQEDDVVAFLKSVGALFTNSYPVTFDPVQVLADEPTPRVLTDLPTYAWNRRQLLDTRSRLVRTNLSRETAKQGLLGPPVALMCPSQRMWRSSLRLADEPWLADHVINDAVLFPAAGYISLVIQAGRQMTTADKTILRDRFRNIVFQRAVVLPEEETMELVLAVQSSAANSWCKFQIWAGTTSKPLQIACTGEWKVEHAPEPRSHLDRELELGHQAACKTQQGQRARCASAPFPVREFYDKARTIGYKFGPSFQKLDNICAIGDNFCASVSWGGVEALNRFGMELDPLVLDAIFQCPIALAREARGLKHPPTPQSIGSMEIAADMLDGQNLDFEVAGWRERIASNKVSLRYSVIGPATKKEVVHISNMICVETRGGRINTSDQSFMCHRLVWGPDLGATVAKHPPDSLAWMSARTGLVGVAELVLSLAQTLTRPRILLVGGSDSPLHNLLRYPSDGIARVSEITCIDDVELTAASVEHTYDLVVCCVAFLDNHMPRLSDIVRFASDRSYLCLSGPTAGQRSFEEELSPSTFRIIYTAETEHQSSTAITSILQLTAPTADAKPVPRVVIVKDHDCETQVDGFAHEVQAALQARGVESSIVVFSANAVSPGAIVISLLELQSSFLSDMTELRLAGVKSLLSASAVLLWVNRTAGPSNGLVTGFARSIRLEYSSLEFRTLHLNVESHGESPVQAALVAQVLCSRPRDLEHTEKSPGVLCTPRFAPDVVLSSFSSVPQDPMHATDDLGQTQAYTQLAVTRPGDSESLLLHEPDLSFNRELEDGEVKVRIVASGINFKDVLIQAGIVNQPQVGGEASGIIEHVGTSVENFQPGDRVLLLAAGAHARVLHAKASLCRHIPANISFVDAATIPINHCTAYYAMMMASGQPLHNKVVLIHNASGGVGQVAIQIAQHLHMEVFATVGSEAKRALLREDYGIPDDHILHSRDASFAMAIARMTRGKGVDLVVNSLNADLAQESLDCLSQYGTYVELSKNPHVQLQPGRDIHISTFDLGTMMMNWPSGFRHAFDGVLQFLEQGITRIVSPVVAHPVSQVQKAVQTMQSPTHRGKLVLTWNDSDIVKFARAPLPMPTLALDANATYILVGGFGGLGRSLARLFAHRGARRLAILGRSAVRAGTPSDALVSELRAQGVAVDVHALDISDESALRATFDHYASHGPPIRGIVQSAMDLQDSLFGGMSVSQWQKSLSPKVTGTWNLHALAPEALDFFIILSSFVALVGNLGQSNYGAGCAYQDRLAEHRRQQGAKAVSINLGVMKEIGVVAEGKVTGASTLKGWDVVGLDENDFHNLMSFVIDDQTHARGRVPATLPTGLPLAKSAVGDPSALIDAKFDLLDLHAVHGGGDTPLAQSTTNTEPTTTLTSLLQAATSEDEAAALILSAIIDRCAKRVGVPREEIVPSMSLANYGFDSLSAVELQTWLVQALGVRLNVFDVLNAASLVELSRHCAQMV